MGAKSSATTTPQRRLWRPRMSPSPALVKDRRHGFHLALPRHQPPETGWPDQHLHPQQPSAPTHEPADQGKIAPIQPPDHRAPHGRVSQPPPPHLHDVVDTSRSTTAGLAELRHRDAAPTDPRRAQHRRRPPPLCCPETARRGRAGLDLCRQPPPHAQAPPDSPLLAPPHA